MINRNINRNIIIIAIICAVIIATAVIVYFFKTLDWKRLIQVGLQQVGLQTGGQARLGQSGGDTNTCFPNEVQVYFLGAGQTRGKFIANTVTGKIFNLNIKNMFPNEKNGGSGIIFNSGLYLVNSSNNSIKSIDLHFWSLEAFDWTKVQIFYNIVGDQPTPLKADEKDGAYAITYPIKPGEAFIINLIDLTSVTITGLLLECSFSKPYYPPYPPPEGGGKFPQISVKQVASGVRPDASCNPEASSIAGLADDLGCNGILAKSYGGDIYGKVTGSSDVGYYIIENTTNLKIQNILILTNITPISVFAYRTDKVNDIQVVQSNSSFFPGLKIDIPIPPGKCLTINLQPYWDNKTYLYNQNYQLLDNFDCVIIFKRE